MVSKAFYVALYDDESRVFELRGPMADDTALTNRVYEAQQRGRKVRCSTTSATASEIASTTGYATGTVAL